RRNTCTSASPWTPRTAGWSRSSATWTGKACWSWQPKRPHWQTRRATRSSAPTTCRAPASPYPVWGTSAAPTSRRSSTHRKWPSSASAGQPCNRSGTARPSSRGCCCRCPCPTTTAPSTAPPPPSSPADSANCWATSGRCCCKRCAVIRKADNCRPFCCWHPSGTSSFQRTSYSLGTLSPLGPSSTGSMTRTSQCSSLPGNRRNTALPGNAEPSGNVEHQLDDADEPALAPPRLPRNTALPGNAEPSGNVEPPGNVEHQLDGADYSSLSAAYLREDPSPCPHSTT